ncbi:rCG56435 [Rattus norvegicus]|uniref:RCG56435 n=1 Tax=Rattus norvegicus TaxID=10116 RepID=A6IAD7_RAT|nr:rCG56435 [Rattus norvegicus]
MMLAGHKGARTEPYSWRDSVNWDRRELSPQILFTKL